MNYVRLRNLVIDRRGSVMTCLKGGFKSHLSVPLCRVVQKMRYKLSGHWIAGYSLYEVTR